MTKYRGDLFVGGLSLKKLETFIEDEVVAEPSHWAGYLTLDRTDQHVLAVRRPYLLMLEDGRMNRVRLTEIRSGPDATHINAVFEACD
jgi:hypothetical protein